MDRTVETILNLCGMAWMSVIITVQCDGRTAAIHVASDSRPFVVRVDLPSYVDDTPGETQFNNGIFEVTFDRDTDPANIGFH